MIVRRLEEISGTERDVEGPTFVSRRFLLANDAVGFSLHDTVLYAGTVTDMWYANHIEAVYCIEGHATLYDKINDETYDIRPGTIYTLDGHEKHRLTVHEDVRMVCVFNPPLTGRELHDENGTYPLLVETDSASTGSTDGAAEGAR